jgi:spore germination protein KC
VKIILILSLILLLVVAGGCWDWRIIDDLSIVFGMGIDPVEDEPEMLEITFVHPIFNPQSGETRVARTVRGYSLQQALFNLQYQTDQQPVLGKLVVIVFSEEAARSDGMRRILMEFDQIRDNNPMAWVCMVRGVDAQKVLTMDLPEQPRAAVFLSDLFNQNSSEGRIPQITVASCWIRIHTPGVTPVIPVVELAGPEGEEPNGILLAGLAVIDEAGRMKGTLSDTETLLYMMLTGDMQRGRFDTQIDFLGQEKRVITAFIQKSSSRVQTKIQDDKAAIEIKTEIILNGLNADLMTKNVLQKDLFRELEIALARDIQGNMLRLLEKTRQWESDIFGFGQFVRAQNPRWFEGKNWGREYSESDIRIEVKVQIKRMGTLINPVP